MQAGRGRSVGAGPECPGNIVYVLRGLRVSDWLQIVNALVASPKAVQTALGRSGRVAGRLSKMGAPSTAFDSDKDLEDPDYEMDVGHPDCEIDEMLQEGGSAAEGDYGVRGDLIGDGSAHLPEALADHELRREDLIFQREDTSTGCQPTGQYTAGTGVVPWSGQHEGESGREEYQPLGQENREGEEAKRKRMPKLSG